MAFINLLADGSVRPGRRPARGRRFLIALAIAFAAAAGSAHAAFADGVQLALSTTQAAVGAPVTMTATVTSSLGQPLGTVTFVNLANNQPLDSPLGETLLPVNASTTTASFTTTSLPAGTYTVQAQYSVDSLTNIIYGIGNMNSASQTLTIGGAAPPQKFSTQTTFTGPPTVVSTGPIVLTANVARTGGALGAPGGTVEFDDATSGSNISLGTATLDASGNATLNLQGLSVGPHYISASYSGDGSDLGSSSAVALVQSNPAQDTRLTTVTSVSSSPATIAQGDPVIITATITQIGHAVQPPGNAVTFTSNSQCGQNVLIGTVVLGTGPPGVAVAPNQAAIASNTFPSCDYVITASYQGDSLDQPSSGSLALSVLPPRSATVIQNTGDTAVEYGHATTLATTVTDQNGTPIIGKTVTFTLGSQQCTATTNANGVATCAPMLQTQDVANYTLTISVPRDLSISGSTATFPYTVTQQPTTLTVGYALGASATTLTGTLLGDTGPLANQPLTLSLGSESCTATTGATGIATCTVVPLTNQTSATLSGSFAGTTDYTSASASRVVPLSVGTVLTYNGATSATFGGTASLSATLTQSDGTPLVGRTVSFSVGSQTCQATTNANGVATCSIAAITQHAGPYTVSAGYAGDNSTGQSTASAPFTVNKAATTTVAATPTVGFTSTVLSATLTTAGSPLPNKPLTLSLGSSSCNATTGANGVATCTVTNPAGTSATFTASFVADADYAASSGTKNAVLPTPTTLRYTGVQTVVYKGSAALSATLTQADGVTPVSGRVVTFALGSQTCQATTAANGTASCTIAAVTADAGPTSVNASFAGDASNQPSSATAAFTVTRAATAVSAAAPTVSGSTTALSATLTSAGSALPAKPLTLTLGTNSCTATTNATGVASCSVSTPSASSAQYTASFAGDTDYAPAADTRTVALLAPATITFLGGTSTDYHDLAIFSAILTGTNNAPLSGQAVTFTVGTQSCTSVTLFGIALCFIDINQPTGSYTTTISYGGNSTYAPTTVTSPFTITPEEANITPSVASAVLNGGTATLGGTLRENDGSPISGRTVTLTLGTKSCTAVTNSAGYASCSVAVTGTLGPTTVTASFAGDTYYAADSGTTSTIEYSKAPGGGWFTIGDHYNGTVTWWGTSWSSANGSGSSLSSYHGWAHGAGTCGSTWTSDTTPPTSVPAYMAVLVTSSAGKYGSGFSGNTTSIAIVKTNTGFNGTTSHAGTGIVVATLNG